jgi:hypothetical protein
VVYAATKLLASRQHIVPAATCLALLPLPVVAFWAYVLLALLREEFMCPQQSRVNYGDKYARHPTNAQLLNQDFINPQGDELKTMGRTLALLGSPDENPTLIIRDKLPGEEGFDHFASDDSSTSDEHDGEAQQPRAQAVCRVARRAPSGACGRPALPRLSFLPGQSFGQPSAGGSDCALSMKDAHVCAKTHQPHTVMLSCFCTFCTCSATKSPC